MKVLLLSPDVGLFKRVGGELAKRGGNSVHYGRRGDRALGLMEWIRPDAVIVDLLTPGLGGPSFLRKSHELEGCGSVVYMVLDHGLSAGSDLEEGETNRLVFLYRRLAEGRILDRLLALGEKAGEPEPA